MGLLTTTAKAARKLADEWDEAAWLKENPRPEGTKKTNPKEWQRWYDKKSYAKNKEKKLRREAEKRASDPEAYEAKKARERERYREKREGLLEGKKEYYEKNKEDIKEKGKAYREANKEVLAARNKKWREENADYVKQKKAEYYSENKEELIKKQTPRSAKRRAAKLERTPDYSNEEAIQRFYEQAGLLSEATGTPHHVDHVIPLQGENVSGLHVPGNLMIVPDNLNLSKNNAFTPGDDPMRFNDVARQNIAEANEMGLFSFLSKNADKAGLAGVAGVLAAGQSEDADAGLLHAGARGARDFNKYESKHSAQNAQARNIGGGGVLDEAAYQQTVRRAESDPNLRVPRYTDPIVRRNENTFVDPKTGRKKARKVSFAVGDPGTGAQFAQALFDNYETGKQAQMDQAGLTKDPMYEYGTLLPWKQNIVTGEGSPAVPDFLRTMLGGIFGVKSGLQQGIVNPNDLGDIFL